MAIQKKSLKTNLRTNRTSSDKRSGSSKKIAGRKLAADKQLNMHGSYQKVVWT